MSDVWTVTECFDQHGHSDPNDPDGRASYRDLKAICATREIAEREAQKIWDEDAAKNPWRIPMATNLNDTRHPSYTFWEAAYRCPPDRSWGFAIAVNKEKLITE